jgi:hypothetical protein
MKRERKGTYGAYREGKQRIQKEHTKKRTKEYRECKEVINQFSTKPLG